MWSTGYSISYLSADAGEYALSGKSSRCWDHSDNNAEWVKETANRSEPHTTSILGQQIVQWTDERKPEAAGHQEEPEDVAE